MRSAGTLSLRWAGFCEGQDMGWRSLRPLAMFTTWGSLDQKRLCAWSYQPRNAEVKMSYLKTSLKHPQAWHFESFEKGGFVESCQGNHRTIPSRNCQMARPVAAQLDQSVDTSKAKGHEEKRDPALQKLRGGIVHSIYIYIYTVYSIQYR